MTIYYPPTYAEIIRDYLKTKWRRITKQDVIFIHCDEYEFGKHQSYIVGLMADEAFSVFEPDHTGDREL